MSDLPEKLPDLKYLDTASKFLDTRFRIPGTDIRFGIDFLVGLVPVAGDIISFGFSGLLVLAMVRHGASGMVILKMLWNILLDSTVGAIPILGDLFDLQYKANRRNYHLLTEHYESGEHQGSAWPVVLLVLIVLFGLLVLLIWGLYQLVDWLWDGLLSVF
jgi:hypothetical protein